MEPDGIATIISDDALILRGQTIRSTAPGTRVTLSIRPEKAFLSVQPPPAGTPNCHQVRVERIAYIGSDTRIDVRLGCAAVRPVGTEQPLDARPRRLLATRRDGIPLVARRECDHSDRVNHDAR